MPKDDQEHIETAGKPNGAGGAEERDAAPMTVRESIKAAIKTVSEEPEIKEETQVEETVEEPEIKESKSTSSDDEYQVSSEPEVKEEPSIQKKVSPPNGWTKEGKAVWNKLPPDVQKSVIKREEEVSKGIAQYSQKAKAYDELDQVLAPRRQAIQRFGVTEPQVIDNLFKWMEALGHPDVNVKANTFKKLAENFGLDLAQLVPKQQQQQENNQEPDPVELITNQFNSLEERLQGRIANTFEQAQVQAQQRAAQEVVMNWASDKPHFQKVRKTMYGLLDSGTIPLLTNGHLDLDEAYKQAVRLHPDTKDLVLQEEAEAKAKMEQAERAKKAREAKIKLDKAKTAGSSIKPGTLTVSDGDEKKKTLPKNVSVRDSIRAAIEEHSNA
jgi:hypothetical protein